MYKISPGDVTKQEFKKILRGYDPIEVDTFLEMIAVEFELLIKKNIELQEQIAAFESEAGEQPETQAESDIRPTVDPPATGEVPFTDTSAAEAEARDILRDARSEKSRIESEIAVLKEKRTSFVKVIKKELRAQIEILRVFEADEKILSESAKAERLVRKGSLSEAIARNTAEISVKSPEPESESVESQKTTPTDSNDNDTTKDAAETPDKKEEGKPETTTKFQDGFDLIDQIIDEDEDIEESPDNEDDTLY